MVAPQRDGDRGRRDGLRATVAGVVRFAPSGLPPAPAMPRFALLPAAAPALLALALPAVAAIVPLAFSADGRFQLEQRVAPGKFVEVCGPLEAGRDVRWRFESDAVLDFNIHVHVGSQIEYPARDKATRGAEGTLRPTRREDYCWMWTHRGNAPATLKLWLAR